MIPQSIINLIENFGDASIDRFFEDDTAAFAVDWREEDDAIPEYCENVLQTGQIRFDLNELDQEPGYELILHYADKQAKVPLTYSPDDRHITLHTLNQLIAPDYEIRVSVDSNGCNTLVFVPLAAADWCELETRFGDQLHARFERIEERPNLFTDHWGEFVDEQE